MIAQKLKTLTETISKETNENLSKNPRYLFSTIFGINDFTALILQSILTRVVADKNGLLALDEEHQVIF